MWVKHRRSENAKDEKHVTTILYFSTKVV